MHAVDNRVAAPKKVTRFPNTEVFHQRQGQGKLLSVEKTELCIYTYKCVLQQLRNHEKYTLINI